MSSQEQRLIPVSYWFLAGSIILFWIVGLAFYRSLPEQSAIHWSAPSQEPDGYAGRGVAAFFLPLIVTVLWPFFMAVGIAMRNLGTGVAVHYDVFLWLTMGLLLFVHVTVLAWNVWGPFNFSTVMSWAMGIFLVAVVIDFGVLIIRNLHHRRGQHNEG